MATLVGLINSMADSAWVQSLPVSTFTNDANYLDSTTVQGVIDASYINAFTIDADTLGGQNSAYHLDYGNFTNTPTIPSFGNDYVDSAQVVALVDSDYVQARAIEADPVGTAVAMAIALG